MLKTRLEKNWNLLKGEVLARWGGLSEFDFAGFDGKFDQLVEIIRKRHMPERSHLSVEADIRDWLIERITRLENEDLNC